jgi:hypothetical protein
MACFWSRFHIGLFVLGFFFCVSCYSSYFSKLAAALAAAALAAAALAAAALATAALAAAALALAALALAALALPALAAAALAAALAAAALAAAALAAAALATAALAAAALALPALAAAALAAALAAAALAAAALAAAALLGDGLACSQFWFFFGYASQCNLPARVVGPSPILHRRLSWSCLMALQKVAWKIVLGVLLHTRWVYPAIIFCMVSQRLSAPMSAPA